MNNFMQSFNIGANSLAMTARYFKFILISTILFSILAMIISSTLLKDLFGLTLNMHSNNFGSDIAILLNIFNYSFVTGIVLSSIIAHLFAKKYQSKIQDEHLKGSSVLSEDALQKIQIKNQVEGYNISEKIKLNKQDTTRMVGIFGSTGAGKSVLLRKLFKQIYNENTQAKIIFYDPKPEFFTEFYNPKTDIILSLEDKRSAHINLLELIKNTRDLNRVVASIIPSALKSEEEGWIVMSRAILSGIFIYCLKNEIKTMKELRSLTLLPFTRLLNLLSSIEGTEQAIQFLDIDEKQQTINQSVFSSKIAFISEYPSLDCPPLKNGYINFDTFFKSNGRRAVWILGDDNDEKEKLKRTVSVVIELAANAVFLLGEDQNRELFFFVDEFSELKSMQALLTLIVKGRSFGCSIFLLMQNPFQLKKTYGEEDAETILSCLNTNFIFKSNGDKTLEILSNIIGKQKIKELNSNQSYGISVYRDGTSHNESRKIENAVLGSEIKKLELGEIFFGDINGDWAKIKVAYNHVTDKPISTYPAHQYCENLIISKVEATNVTEKVQTRTEIKGKIWG